MVKKGLKQVNNMDICPKVVMALARNIWGPEKRKKKPLFRDIYIKTYETPTKERISLLKINSQYNLRTQTFWGSNSPLERFRRYSKQI